MNIEDKLLVVGDLKRVKDSRKEGGKQATMNGGGGITRMRSKRRRVAYALPSPIASIS
jgi:hypothetical protein